MLFVTYEMTRENILTTDTVIKLRKNLTLKFNTSLKYSLSIRRQVIATRHSAFGYAVSGERTYVRNLFLLLSEP